MSKIHYAVAITKRKNGCTENQDSWLWANWQHVYFFSKVHRNIECTITGARKSHIARPPFLLLYKQDKVVWLCETRSKTLFFQFHHTADQRFLVHCTFMVMQKLGRSYKLGTSKVLVLTVFNLIQTLSSVNLSILIYRQIFPLYSMNMASQIELY